MPGPATLAILFTDVEGSTGLWERHPDEMHDLLAEHDTLVADAVEASNGDLVRHTGDGACAVFTRGRDLVAAAVEIQRAVDRQDWSPVGKLRIREGGHLGEVRRRGNEYFGRAMNRAARLQDAAYGGQILVSQSVRDDAAATGTDADGGVEFHDLGEHLFRGLGVAERVHQVVAPGLRPSFPPVRSELGFELLPAATTTMIGRGADRDGIRTLLGAGRLTTIVGPPGIGKTRLACEFASNEWRAYRDGVRLVELTAARSGDEVPAVVAAALGVRAGGNPTRTVLEALESQHQLVLFDNCEPVLPAVAQFLGELVTRCRWLHVLATSRVPIGVTGERIWRLDELTTGHLSTAPQSEAAELFIDRATAVRPGFAPDHGELPKVEAICGRLGGNPLALELAARRLGEITLDELDQATTGPLTALRHRGVTSRLEQALDWSVGQLGPADQALLPCLSVFAGSFTTEAVEAVCSPGTDPRPVLTRLTNASLLVADLDLQRPRFRLHPAVREHSHLRLGGELRPLRAGHAEYFLRRAEATGPQVRTASIRTAVAEIDAELGDMRAAFTWLVRHHRFDEAARLVVALNDHCLYRMRTELFSWAEEVLPHLGDTHPEVGQLGGIAALASWFRGDHHQCIERGLEAVERAERTGGRCLWARTALVNAMSYLLFQHVSRGEWDEVAELQQRIRPHYLGLQWECRADPDDPYWMTNAYAYEALSRLLAGDQAAGMRAARRALEQAQASGNPDCLYWAHYVVGRAEPDRRAARVEFELAVRETRSIGSWFNFILAMGDLIHVNLELGDVTDAAALSLELLEQLNRGSNRSQLWQAVDEAAEIIAAAGNHLSAAQLHYAVAGKPRMPRTALSLLPATELDAVIESALNPDELAEARARSRLDTPEILQLCQDRLLEIVRRQ